MIIRKRIANLYSRKAVVLFLAAWEAIILVMLFTGARETWYIPTAHQLLWLILGAAGFSATEIIGLFPEGIQRHLLFRTQHYAWSEIQQTGKLLWKPDRGSAYWVLILVPRIGGVRHTSTDIGDQHFRFRHESSRRNIVIPFSDTAEQIINQHYGPLDFDLSNEQQQ